jgi:acetyl-CoA synthetase
MLRSIWGNDKRYLQYYDFIKSKNRHLYFSGDGAYYDDNGYIIITGRTDDVMNVSGHRVSSAEVESVITGHDGISEVAVVSKPDKITGESIVAYAVMNSDFNMKNSEVKKELNAILKKEIGPIIKINQLVFVPGLPKTRSGKVLRRVLRSIAHNEQINYDLSTISDPEIVNIIKDIFKNE